MAKHISYHSVKLMMINIPAFCDTAQQNSQACIFLDGKKWFGVTGRKLFLMFQVNSFVIGFNITELFVKNLSLSRYKGVCIFGEIEVRLLRSLLKISN